MPQAAEREKSEKSLGRQMRAFEWVRRLAELPDRFAGGTGEREAAERGAGWLRELGFEKVALEGVESRPRVGGVLALHLGLAALGCVLGGFLGAALAGLAAWSFRRELRSAELVLSRCLPAPDAVNVVARIGAEGPRRRIVLSAHIDTTQAGWLFSPRLAELFARRARPTPNAARPPRGPHALPEALLLGTAAVLVAAWLGADGFLVGLAQLGAGIGCAAGALLGLQWSTAEPTPGANDNASGVVAMLTCAERLAADLPADVELWVLGSGAEEVGCRGMRSFVAEHRDWPPETTGFVNFECVGGGALHWVRTEGTLAKTAYPPQLVELARRIAASGAFGDITPTDLLAATDGNVPAAHGHPTLSLISLEASGVPRNYHRPEDVPEALDMPTVVRAADFGAAVAGAVLRGETDPLSVR